MVGGGAVRRDRRHRDGLAAAGVQTELLCEIEPAARWVLRRRDSRRPAAHRHPQAAVTPPGRPGRGRLPVPGPVPGRDDDRDPRPAERAGRPSIPACAPPPRGPRWLFLENVPFMLQLDRGRAMRHLTATLERHGLRWAYRVVDAGPSAYPSAGSESLCWPPEPKTRARCCSPTTLAAASPIRRTGQPAASTGPRACAGWDGPSTPYPPSRAVRPSASHPRPPSGWPTTRHLVTPDIEDAERLQGFPAGWTGPAVDDPARPGHRWKLVGNAVSVPVAKWLGGQLIEPGSYDAAGNRALQPGDAWPTAAWGRDGVAHRAAVGQSPTRAIPAPGELPCVTRRPLSQRATAGSCAGPRPARCGSPTGSSMTSAIISGRSRSRSGAASPS